MQGRRVVLVRHGETEWSGARRHTGRSDVPLTEQGRREADAVAAALAGRRFAAVWSSPLGRAWETAVRAGLTPVADPDLLEWDYGVYEGRTTAEVREEQPGWSVWTHPVTGGEDLADVARRADRVIARVLDLDVGDADGAGDVALVAHAHLLRILAARWLELPPESGRRWTLDTASISELGWERETRVVLRWNLRCA